MDCLKVSPKWYSRGLHQRAPFRARRRGASGMGYHGVNREKAVRVSLAAWAVDVNQTNVLGEGGRKFVTRFNIRNSFTWVVTGEQL